MKGRLSIVAAAALLSLGGAGDALAGANPDVQLALDCRSRDEGRECTHTYSSCADINWICEEPGYYDVIVVVYNYRELDEVEYGIDFHNVQDYYFTGFVKCTDYKIGGFDLGGWISCRQYWAACQYLEGLPPGHNGMALGWLKLYGGAGRIDVIWSDRGNQMTIDCGGQFDLLRGHPCFVGGAQPTPDDEHPCAPFTSAERKEWDTSRWGAIKMLCR